MFYYVFLVFFTLVLYQTVAKKMHWSLPSNGIKYVRDLAVSFWDWFGLFVGRCLNIRRWFKYLEKWLCHIWENIRPFFESIVEVGKPTWQLLFSWSYFFVGFARTHYIFFSWIGGSAAMGVIGYFTRDYWLWMLKNWILYTVSVVALGLFGILTSFPGILFDMFPRTIAFFETQPEPEVTVQGNIYTRAMLLKLRNNDLRSLLDCMGKYHNRLKTKGELVDAFFC